MKFVLFWAGVLMVVCCGCRFCGVDIERKVVHEQVQERGSNASKVQSGESLPVDFSVWSYGNPVRP